MSLKDEFSELLLYFGLGIILPFTLFFAVLVYLAFAYPGVFDKLSTGLAFGGIFLAFISFILYIFDKIWARKESVKSAKDFKELCDRLDAIKKRVDELDPL